MNRPLANIGAAPKEQLPPEAAIRRLTRRSFTVGGLSALAGAAGVGWIATRPEEGGLPWPLRRMLELNESVAQHFFNASRLAPGFPVTAAEELRENGHVGLMSPAQLDDWVVHVIGKVDRHIPLPAIKELPTYEMTTQFKCVEGWDRIVNWKGVRLSDFLNKFGASSDYIGMSTPPEGQTPDGQPDHYYVGLDRPSALHPQTLLCYEINGAPLTQAHGAPLRLVSTVKYGYKCIKRISVIELTELRRLTSGPSAAMTGTVGTN